MECGKEYWTPVGVRLVDVGEVEHVLLVDGLGYVFRQGVGRFGVEHDVYGGVYNSVTEAVKDIGLGGRVVGVWVGGLWGRG